MSVLGEIRKCLYLSNEKRVVACLMYGRLLKNCMELCKTDVLFTEQRSRNRFGRLFLSQLPGFGVPAMTVSK